jgi:regulator of replication initiation timing
MKKRMTTEKRRAQLLEIMGIRFEKARTQSDFTALSLAREADVSVVLFYRLVGGKFKELRSRLDGPLRPPETVISKLKGQVKDLRRQVREYKARLKAAALAEIAEAIRLIERLDEENRMLRSEVKMLRQRLAESEVLIVPPLSREYSIKRQSLTSFSGL